MKTINPTKNSNLFVIALFVVGLAGCTDPIEEEATVLRPVKHIVVSSGSAAIRDRVFSGTAHSSSEANLSFNVNGTVKRVVVKVGDTVKRGDLIAEIDSETYRIEVEQAQAALAQANASRRNTEAEYQRVRQLYTNDNASQNELDTALANAESSKASYNADSHGLRLALLNLDYTKLNADGNCTIANLNIEPNENITSGTTVAEVNCGAGWEVEIGVPESLISAFHDGITGSVQFTAIRGESFSGAVTEIGTATGGNSTFPVTLLMNDFPAIIRSGLAAEVTFQFGAQSTDGDNFYLGPSVVGQDETGTFVFVIEPSEELGAAVLRRRAVEVGGISELGLEIKSGLNNGDKVVTAGQTMARDGLLVRKD